MSQLSYLRVRDRQMLKLIFIFAIQRQTNVEIVVRLGGTW